MEQRVFDESASDLNHDLRTPLNAILGWTSLLLGGRLDADRARMALESIHRNVVLQKEMLEKQVLPLFAATRQQPARPKNDRGFLYHPTEALSGIKVLLVEDHGDSRRYYRQALRDRGARIRSAKSPTRAFAVLEEWQPDVVISNLRMKGESGLDFIRELRSRPPEKGGTIPAAALTGAVTKKTRTQALEAGFQVFVGKPIEPADLVLVVARLAAAAGR